MGDPHHESCFSNQGYIEELTRMRSDGVSRIYIENETLLDLERNLRPKYNNVAAEMPVADYAVNKIFRTLRLEKALFEDEGAQS